MADSTTCLKALIRELGTFIDEREPSWEGVNEDWPGEIKEDWPDLYGAVVELESLFGGRLPIEGWKPWMKLLFVCRDNDERQRSLKAVEAATELRTWALKQLDGPDASNVRLFHYSGREFTFSKRNGQLLHCLDGQDQKISFLDLGMTVWGEETEAYDPISYFSFEYTTITSRNSVAGPL